MNGEPFRTGQEINDVDAFVVCETVNRAIVRVSIMSADVLPSVSSAQFFRAMIAATNLFLQPNKLVLFDVMR